MLRPLPLRSHDLIYQSSFGAGLTYQSSFTLSPCFSYSIQLRHLLRVRLTLCHPLQLVAECGARATLSACSAISNAQDGVGAFGEDTEVAVTACNVSGNGWGLVANDLAEVVRKARPIPSSASPLPPPSTLQSPRAVQRPLVKYPPVTCSLVKCPRRALHSSTTSCILAVLCKLVLSEVIHPTHPYL